MAEFVQQSIEEMVGELHEMQTAGLFDGTEIRFAYVKCQVTWLTGIQSACHTLNLSEASHG